VRPTVALVAAAGAGPEGFGDALEDAARAMDRSVARHQLVLRARPGLERIEEGRGVLLRVGLDALDQALDALDPTADLRVAIGAPYVALARPTLSILVTRGLPPVSWEPSLRAIRDRFHLVVAEPGPGLARELALRLLGAAAAT
jgi:hypothetical protein